ncbi:serine hydrolase [Rhodanobacter sp. C05]|uniref:serine hydrolase n=1 Tax=Rhodanobacter sp. C05 TaxID=1945855 RepID=UPI001C2BB3A2|nr:serine hydrolase [Rhodanobacter sp. C05]
MKTIVVATSLALFGSSSIAQQNRVPKLPILRGNPALQVQGEYVDEMVANFIAAHHLPGLTMAIVQAPYIPRSAGYGKANIDLDELASTKTMWNIGPITQAFTAIAIMQLKEQSKLGLTDAIGEHVDGLPPAWQHITIKQLMQHSSGIADYRSQLDNARRYNPRELIALVANKPLQFRSGTDVRMSATDATLLALAVEQASGMSYHDFVWKYQIDLEGLQSTMFASDFAKLAKSDRPDAHPNDNQHSKFKSEVPYINPVEPATGYVEKGESLSPVAVEASENLFGFGDLWSSAEDISKWDIGLAGTTLIHAGEDHDLLYLPTKLDNGKVVSAMIGWEFTHHPGFMEIKGDSPGFSSYLSRFTMADELVCVTLLSNKQGVDLTVLARDIAAAYQASLGPNIDQQQIVAQESKFGVAETVARIKADLTKAKVPVFSVIDHSENATRVGKQLRPTTVISFGNPKVGTKLMLQNQAIGLELPLHALVWEDEKGRTWIGYPRLDKLADRYGIKDLTTIDAMTGFMDHLVAQAANVYTY